MTLNRAIHCTEYMHCEIVLTVHTICLHNCFLWQQMSKDKNTWTSVKYWEIFVILKLTTFGELSQGTIWCIYITTTYTQRHFPTTFHVYLSMTLHNLGFHLSLGSRYSIKPSYFYISQQTFNESQPSMFFLVSIVLLKSDGQLSNIQLKRTCADPGEPLIPGFEAPKLCILGFS